MVDQVPFHKLQYPGLMFTVTVNQHFFTMTLFHDLQVITWFAEINFCDQQYLKHTRDIKGRNIHNDEVLVKISCLRMKVGLQYSIIQKTLIDFFFGQYNGKHCTSQLSLFIYTG